MGGREDRDNLEERGEVGTVKFERDNGAELKTWRRDQDRGVASLYRKTGWGKKKYDYGQGKWYQSKL